MQASVRFILATAACALCAHAAHAKEVQIDCRLVHHPVDDTSTSTAIDGVALRAFRNVGVCVLPDGRLAEKNFVGSMSTRKGGAEGDYSGFSVYTLENGDAVSVRFEGAWGAKGNHGRYTVLGGTGAFSGATGDGTIEGLKSPWAGATVMKISIRVNTAP